MAKGWQLKCEGNIKTSIADFAREILRSDIHFTFIGLDCCLMCSIETLFTLRHCADYILASEDYVSWNGLVTPKLLGRLDERILAVRPVPDILSRVLDDSIQFNNTGAKADPCDLTLIRTKYVGDLYRLVKDMNLKKEDFVYNHRVDKEWGVLYDLHSAVTTSQRIDADTKKKFEKLYKKVVLRYKQNETKNNPLHKGISVVNPDDITDKTSQEWKNYQKLHLTEVQKSSKQTTK